MAADVLSLHHQVINNCGIENVWYRSLCPPQRNSSTCDVLMLRNYRDSNTNFQYVLSVSLKWLNEKLKIDILNPWYTEFYSSTFVHHLFIMLGHGLSWLCHHYGCRCHVRSTMSLTHWGRDKMTAILQAIFFMHFLQWKLLNFMEVCS